MILRHRLGRPAILTSAYDDAEPARPAGPPFAVDTSIAESATARALVRGPVDITTADQLARRLLSVSRGGTVPLVADLTGVTQLASAGVRALYAVSRQMAAHGQDLTLITAPGSAPHLVLDLVRLAHIAREGLLDRPHPVVAGIVGEGTHPGGRKRQVRSAQCLLIPNGPGACPRCSGSLSGPSLSGPSLSRGSLSRRRPSARRRS